ncbi:MAG: Glucokinase [Phycisphaerae bacterium]|nr:Glucokinase [Phycisphaerae bacterium]
MHASLAIGIDLGGTFIKGGLIDADGAVLQRDSVETQANRGAEHVIARIADLVRRLAGEHRGHLAAVGVGAPGPMSHTAGVIYAAPNLPGWKNVPLRDLLSRATGVPCEIENDANAAAYGEYRAGAGRQVRDLVFLTLGTGIGGGVVIGGQLVRGKFDNAGEVGHMIVEPDGRPCPCGQAGCLERYASARAIGVRVTEAIRAGAKSALQARVVAGEEPDAADVQRAADAGDPVCRRIWDDACRYLALACCNLRHLLNPELIVLGGGLINAGAALLSCVQTHFDRVCWKIAPDAPQIVLATLGTDAGIIGAAALARESAP